MKAVIYGAGNIGRGFIGEIFSKSGYDLCFIDVANHIIDALNSEGRYPIRILAENESKDIWIQGLSAINGRNEEEAALAIASADIMATAVGVRALPLIAPIIAAGLKKRFAHNKGPLNINICENLMNANKILEGLIKDHLSSKDKKSFNEHIGLVEASIGRMVPLQTVEMQDGNFLRVCVEPYVFLPVDKTAFKGEIPTITGLIPFENFDFYIKRKLFIHNMGHGICAYFGLLHGDIFIHESVRHSGILYIAQNAMMESAVALSAKYQMPLADLHHHIRDLLRRFSNMALGDTCARVAADPARKLGNSDRFIGALRFCVKENQATAFISAGCSAAIYHYLKENNIPQTCDNARKALIEVSGLNEADLFIMEKILQFHAMLAPLSQSGDFERNIDKIIEKIISTASII